MKRNIDGAQTSPYVRFSWSIRKMRWAGQVERNGRNEQYVRNFYLMNSGEIEA
jgi:hypothetical protein